jgi:tetratricopeptide (TPR) repeat protein
MEEHEALTWWRCAFYEYLDSEHREHNLAEDEAVTLAVSSLQDTVRYFREGGLNLGTLKYRMDEASRASGQVFPGRKVSTILQDLAMSVPLEDLEPALRRAAMLPEDPGEAKGVLMDLEGMLEGEVSRGLLPPSQARPERWAHLLSCLWHIQDPLSWPVMSEGRVLYLRKVGEMLGDESGTDYPEYAAVMRGASMACGANMMELDHLLDLLARGGLVVPGAEECLRKNLERAKGSEAQGNIDKALELYERVLAIDPRTPLALISKSELYEGKGLMMAAIGEMEALVEVEPRDLAAHRRLLSLYKGQGMVREYNNEVRRFKAVRDNKGTLPNRSGTDAI